MFLFHALFLICSTKLCWRWCVCHFLNVSSCLSGFNLHHFWWLTKACFLYCVHCCTSRKWHNIWFLLCTCFNIHNTFIWQFWLRQWVKWLGFMWSYYVQIVHCLWHAKHSAFVVVGAIQPLWLWEICFIKSDGKWEIQLYPMIGQVHPIIYGELECWYMKLSLSLPRSCNCFG